MRSHVWNVNPFWYGHFAIGGRAIACFERNNTENTIELQDINKTLFANAIGHSECRDIKRVWRKKYQANKLHNEKSETYWSE